MRVIVLPEELLTTLYEGETPRDALEAAAAALGLVSGALVMVDVADVKRVTFSTRPASPPPLTIVSVEPAVPAVPAEPVEPVEPVVP